ncbi:endoplasmic reticulum domain containing protein [Niveomyces insectorum RCEF 264]|uniref:Endoplasmic reticulum domain containing protein n=1 Tax=Niveomyces insectorum RCEF 264 TaxID=1081102 RepID=A0A167MH68_9HYPO|nr:endoplasmic reticulum domain containing protein [Niveomyces insectorum RCEF 264]
MKIATLAVGLLAALVPVIAAWSKEDHEIFRVRDELAAALGPGVTFYDFVGVAPSASLDDINRAYRKKSRALHPDKVKQQLAAERAKAAAKDSGTKKHRKPGVRVTKGPTAAETRAAIKHASDMQARLSIVTNILRGPERDRYDHFLAHGFPVWKGTEYYYDRYRPGFGTVLVGLFICVGGGAHYVALYTGWKRQREFVERYIQNARQAAWGDTLGDALGGLPDRAGLPGPTVADPGLNENEPAPLQPALNRKQRRLQERDAKREASRDITGGGSGGRRRHAGGGASPGVGGSGSATPITATTAGPTGTKKRIVAQNGKVLVVDALGDVYLEQVDENGNVEELLLDVDEVARPTFRDTAVYRLPVWIYSLTVAGLFPKANRSGSDASTGEKKSEAPKPRSSGRKPRTAAAAAEAGPTAKGRGAVAPDDNSGNGGNGDAKGDGDNISSDVDDDDNTSSAGKATPSTDSNDEFELLEKSSGSLGGQVKATGISNANKPRANKRRGRKK